MSLKRLLRPLLPGFMRKAVSEAIIVSRERRLQKLDVGQAFDLIYRRGMWQQGNAASGVGSEGVLAERYVTFVKQYVAENNLSTVVDAGCGDFSVGRQLAGDFVDYVGIDVSEYIIQQNEDRFRFLSNVKFIAADIGSVAFPACDLILIRQVLQHLTNAQIHKVLANLERGHWRRVLVTDAVPAAGEIVPNVDLPTHSVRTRVSFGSGVFLDCAPFSVKGRRLATIKNDDATVRDSAEALLVFELSRDP